MTVVKSTETAEVPLSALGLNLVRYYLGNRWALLALGGLAAIIGLSFGGWSWLVAVGLAPVLLSTLPCLVMCGLGVCMMCRGEKQSASSRDAVDAATPPASIGIANKDGSAVGASSCCHGGAGETQSSQVKQAQSINERRDSHA